MAVFNGLGVRGLVLRGLVVVLGLLGAEGAERAEGQEAEGSKGLAAERQGAEGLGAGGAVPEKLRFKIPPLPRPRVEMSTINRMNSLLPPNPKPWPKAFSATFYTNLTVVAEDESQHLSSSSIKGKLWYDEVKGQRVFHGAGSKECLQFYNTEAQCTLVFNQGGMFAETEKGCCLDMPEIKQPPSNWTLTPHEFIGTKRIKGRVCHGWRYLGAQGMRVSEDDTDHHYYQDVKTHLPCLFTFPGNPLMTWVFDVDSVVLEPQDSQFFDVPDGCRAKRCLPARKHSAPKPSPSRFSTQPSPHSNENSPAEGGGQGAEAVAEGLRG